MNLALTTPLLVQPGRTQLIRVGVGISSAQLLLLNTTPITLVPAPGVGFTIVPILTIFTFVGGTVAYLDGGGGAIGLTLGTVLAQNLANNNIVLVTTSPSRKQQVLPWAGTTDTAANPPAEDNAPMQLTKATGNLTAGNGVMQVTVYYVIEPTT